MEYRLAQAKCGGAIAYLEGRKQINIPDDIISASTLSSLDHRLRRLEGNFSITSPPPSLDPTWDSLALRIYRLQKEDWVLRVAPVSVPSFPSGFLELVPVPSEVSIETLQTLCAEIKPLLHYQPSSQYGKPWPKYADDDDALDVIRQRFCHAAGQSKMQFKAIPYTRSEIYAALVDLTMSSNRLKRPGGTVPLYPPPSMKPGPPPAVVPVLSARAGKRQCRYCRNCVCQSRKPKADDASSVSSFGRKKKSPGGIVGFFKKLAFWRRPKPITDDSCSTCSSDG